ncbi:MAG: nuclear transport factor 2 family protein [Bacteroidaceae bacterium]|nr:nuclear transport factor 2 family protein [Bacteroidaceae bacterium]
MKKNLLKSLLVAAVMMIGMNTASYAQFQNFENKTHTPEAQPFADLSQKIWDLMAEKNADALKEIFHPNAMFVHMGGYWGTEQELTTIGGGFIHYKQADVYGVDVKQINENNWAVYSTIVLDAVLGGGQGGGNDVITPFFVTQTFTKENGKWLLTAFVFTTRMGGPGADRANH